MQAISEEIENKKMQIIKPTKRITKVLSVKKQVEKTAEQASEKQKPSKFVTRIRNIGNPEPDIEFLNVELDCVNEAENKIEASLARLDIKAIKAKCMSEVSALNQEVEQLEGSLNRLNLELAQKPDNKLREIPEKIAQDLQDKKTDVQNQDFNELKIERRFDLVEKNLVAHNDNQKFPVKTTHNSRYAQISDEEFSDNLSKYESRSIYSAHPYPRKQLIDEDLQSVISVVPVKRDASVFEGGSVFGDNTSTRSKKYSIIHKKESQQKLMSMRGDTSSLSDTKSVSGDIVHINPNVNLKALFFDDIEE